MTVPKGIAGGLLSGNPSGARGNIGAAPRFSMVAQQCGVAFSAFGSGATPYIADHQRIVFPYGADAIQLVYPGWYLVGSTGNGEFALPPSMFQATGVTYSGGTGYAVGDIDTFATSNTTAIAPVRVMITAVSGGVPTQYQVIDGGIYNTPLSASASPASTTASGTGATATFTWSAAALGMHVGIEAVWNTATFIDAYEPATKGSLAAGVTNWNLLVPSGDNLITDILPVDVPIGGAIGLRTSIGYGASVPAHRIPISSVTCPGAPSANYEGTLKASTFTDYTTSGTIGTTVAQNHYSPLMILGIPKKTGPSVICAFGNSRSDATSSGLNSISSADVGDKDGNFSWFEKALSSTQATAFWPWSNLSVGSDQFRGAIANAQPIGNAFFLGGRYGRLKACGLGMPTAAYVGDAVNDFINATKSLATVQAYEQQLIAELRGMGVKYIFTSTTDPVSSSTDSWATTGNQTANSHTANITGRNAALRAGTHAPYDFFIDFSPVTESAVGSGLWRVNGTANYYTGDGLHASPQAITLKAALAASVMAANIVL